MKLVGIAAVAAAWLVVGCRHAPASKIEGRWKGVRAEGVGAATQEAADGFAAQMEITARGNAITVSTPAARGQQDNYVIDDENKTTVVLHTERDGPANKETFLFSDEGRSMTWRLGEGRSISFRKIKE